MAVEAVQQALDTYLSGHYREQYIDYIHGNKGCLFPGRRKLHDTLAILLPDIEKNDFFHRITEVGNFPRKTFSIGEAREKRYYLEARLLITE